MTPDCAGANTKGVARLLQSDREEFGSVASTLHSFRFSPSGNNQVVAEPTGISESPRDGCPLSSTDRVKSEDKSTKENHMSPEENSKARMD